jgi:hypothetical protein
MNDFRIIDQIALGIVGMTVWIAILIRFAL